jgi:methyl-accepting chemotaxis protein
MENGQRQAQEGVAWVLEADQALVGISEAVSHITDMTWNWRITKPTSVACLAMSGWMR